MSLIGQNVDGNSAALRKLQQELQKRKKMVYYRKNPLAWLVDKLNFDPQSIRWSDYPEYENHKWDAKDPNLITPDPLYRALNSLAAGKDTGIEASTVGPRLLIRTPERYLIPEG